MDQQRRSEKLSPEDYTDIKMGRVMQDLVASPGWKAYEQIIERTIRDDRAVCELPLFEVMGGMKLTNMEEARAYQEAIKGALKRSRWLLQLPASIIAASQDLIRKSGETVHED